MLPGGYHEGLPLSAMPRPNYKPSSMLPPVHSVDRPVVQVRQLADLKRSYVDSERRQYPQSDDPVKVPIIPTRRADFISQRMAELQLDALESGPSHPATLSIERRMMDLQLKVKGRNQELSEARQGLEERINNLPKSPVCGQASEAEVSPAALLQCAGMTPEQISVRLRQTLDEHGERRSAVKRAWTSKICDAISPRFDRCADQIGKGRWEAIYGTLPYERSSQVHSARPAATIRGTLSKPSGETQPGGQVNPRRSPRPPPPPTEKLRTMRGKLSHRQATSSRPFTSAHVRQLGRRPSYRATSESLSHNTLGQT